ncbi:MAG: hypothetical protein JWM27_3377 [Gemmatimonadetes bacterium]|nr:hypothetical protein [Gemmatimonadota bacterium]
MDEPYDLRPAFQHFVQTFGSRGTIGGIAQQLADGALDAQQMDAIVARDGTQNALWFRKDLLDLILYYTRHSTERASFSSRQEAAVKWLKAVFRVQEGEFFIHRPAELSDLLNTQMDRMLHDYEIDELEDLQQVVLQRAFDLSYDQYLALNRVTLERVVLDLQDLVERGGGDAELRRKQLAALIPIQRLASSQKRTLGARF